MEKVNREYRNEEYCGSIRYTNSEDWIDYPDVSDWKKEIVITSSPFSCSNLEAMLRLIGNVEHIIKCDVPGDFVECGVFMGGSCIVIAQTLRHLRVEDRAIWMFDTFEGVPEPNETEIDGEGNNLRKWYLETQQKGWCYSSKHTVSNNMRKFAFNGEVHLIPGLVEDTIPRIGPNTIALLRIDVDLEDPTRHILEHMYPRLSTNGHIIFDDYGHFPDVKSTVDEYLAIHAPNIYLDRVNRTVMHGVKP